MASVSPNTTIREYQNFVQEVYGFNNDRGYSLWDMLSNIERFTMRGLKGIRKSSPEKTKLNLLISLSWFMSLLNRLHINLEDEVWKRFPYLCSYCASCPCICKESKVESRQKVLADESKRPKTMEEFQQMFENIYSRQNRTLEHAGVHLAEELGEFSEMMLAYWGMHKEADFERVMAEAADFFSCIVGIFNSMGISIAKELSEMFSLNCHVCKKAPCECSFDFVAGFKS